MRKLIQKAMADGFSLLEKQTPKTKKIALTRSLLDISPMYLPALMISENIPEDAEFCITDSEPYLTWEVSAEMNIKDQREYRHRRFPAIAYKFVYKLLTSSGYYRHGYDTSSLKQFKHFCIYSAYINNDLDTLSKYYSLSFSLLDKNHTGHQTKPNHQTTVNITNLDRFRAAYQIRLESELESKPDNYKWFDPLNPVLSVERYLDKAMAHLRKNEMNLSPALKQTCKELGLKQSTSAIAVFINT